jgi:uncharacterized membrane protein YfcA
VTPAAALLVLGAGFVGGAANAVAGGGTLVTFPALLAAGLPPVAANTTSSVGLLSGYVGGSVAYRRELEGQGARARGLLLAGVVGGVLGAVVLLVAPGDSFATPAGRSSWPSGSAPSTAGTSAPASA